MRKAAENKGFTLVEVIVGMLMLAIVIVSVLTAFASAARNTVFSKKEQSAKTLAANLMEYVKAGGEDYTGIFGGTKEEATPGNEAVSVLRGVGEGFYTFDVELEKNFDVVEYDTAWLNDYREILLDSGGDGTVLIDLSGQGTAYDMYAVDTFYAMHEQYVTNYNEKELAEWREQVRAQSEGLGPGEPTPTPLPSPIPMLPVTRDEVLAQTTRELVLCSEGVSYGKMQLTAKLFYTLGAGITIPVGVERDIVTQIFGSRVYDSGNDAVAGTNTLEKIYVLYAPFAGGSSGTDIRVLDEGSSLNADLFLVWSEDARELPGDELYEKTMAERTGGKQLTMSFFSRESVFAVPYRLRVYSSVLLNKEVSPAVEYYDFSLVPTGETERIAAVKIKVTDPESGKTLANLSSAYTE